MDGRAGGWDRAKVVPWAVALAVGGIVVLPQLLLVHYKGTPAVLVVAGIVQWLILAAILRFVVYLADRFRR